MIVHAGIAWGCQIHLVIVRNCYLLQGRQQIGKSKFGMLFWNSSNSKCIWKFTFSNSQTIGIQRIFWQILFFKRKIKWLWRLFYCSAGKSSTLLSESKYWNAAIFFWRTSQIFTVVCSALFFITCQNTSFIECFNYTWRKVILYYGKQFKHCTVENSSWSLTEMDLKMDQIG